MTDMPDEHHLAEALLDAARPKPTITVRPVTFYVTGLPDDNEDAFTWMLTIEWRGPGDLWAVMHHGRCLATDRVTWDMEPSPSNRDDDWKATHRFPWEQAVDHAVNALPKLVINGLCVRDGKLVEAS